MPVRYEVRDHIAAVTLDRPEALNALDAEMSAGLADAWERAERDADVRVVLVTGVGRSFCAGADLKTAIPALAGRARDEGLSAGARDAGGERRPSAIMRDRVYPKPIVAAVNGFCIAGGFELLLTTDLRYASTDAVFALQEVRWGLFPLAGSTVRLPRQIPYCRAMEILLLGERIDAQTALQIGLINEVVPPEQLLERAYAAARRLCANGPLAVTRIKESVVRGLGLSMSEAFREETRLAGDVFASQDAIEGPRAFVEKREPRFTGM